MRLFSTAVALFILVLIAAAPGARAETRVIKIESLSAYPSASPGFNKLAGLKWPGVKSLSVEVKLDLAGFTDEQKIDLFLVLFDEQNNVVQKQREKYVYGPGKHTIVVSDFFGLNQVFGAHKLALKAEAALKGAQSAKAGIPLTVEGPAAPRIEILEMEVYSPLEGKGATRFGPGDEFVFSALIEVGKNESDIRPVLRLYGQVEEEEYYGLKPEAREQQFTRQWDEVALPAGDGVFEVRANGRLPYYFSSPWDFSHPFRIWALVGFGDGRWKKDYARGKLIDQGNGEDRRSENVEERLITLDRGYQWDVQHRRAAVEP